MKKLTLDLDALRVESFDTDSDARDHGTVHAHGYANLEQDCTCACSGETCAASCLGSCMTCGGATDPCICDPVEPVRDFGY